VSVHSETGTGVRARPPGARGQSGPAAPVLPGRARPGPRPGPRPGARPGTRRPGGTPQPGPDRSARPDRATRPGGPWAAGPAAAIARTPFILFVTGLLGGGLICLLVINTILATGSYRITYLQQAQSADAQQVQALKQQVAADSAPSVIARRARQLGMVEPPLTRFLDLRAHRIISQPSSEPGIPAVPGYVP